MKKSAKFAVWLLILSLIVPVFSGCGKKSVQYKLDLEVWGVFDDADAYREIIAEYRKINPFIKGINYKKFTVDNYKKDIINALASGNGPDIFMINNSWMPEFEDKVAPAPSYLINEHQFRSNFVDVAADDFLGKSGEIYGAPLSVDSLALYYNKDIFNAAGIANPPKNWEEVVEYSKKITSISDIGSIERAGIALGTSYNINRSTDIIDLLFFQHGTEMPTRNNPNFKVDFNIGTDVLEFYTQFARSSSPAYSWNSAMHYSIDSFYEGDLAMMLNYSWHIETLKSKNAKLNFATAKIPQLSEKTPANVANYWSFVVNKNKLVQTKEGEAPINNEERIHEAWEFLKFMTFKNDGSFNVINIKSKGEKAFATSIDPAGVYLESTKKPAARRDLIETQKSDPMLSPFAYGNLIAETWYRKDAETIENVWAEIINSINKGDMKVMEGINLIRSRIDEINR
ncbi:MAG: extracellular solute-binding protein [Candidatus Moranbacteria bacterium]|nr:extracellular solute-binding protein [Candidatus Moranbacteria bacterium]MDX9855838.1 extracellular solute-binding protein [Candidatus Moranbacteria bacterium]